MQLTKYIILAIIVLITSSCNKNESEADLLYKVNADGDYGQRITLKIKNEISKLLEAPKVYLGQDVLISGEITEVCPMRGCWINVKDLNTNSNIRVKVTDGKIVFPLSAKGKHVDVQGEFSKLEFTKKQARDWKIHLAEEQGIKLKPKDIEITPEDLVEYRIKGVGANIYTYGCK
jgi:hypothetical protein